MGQYLSAPECAFPGAALGSTVPPGRTHSDSDHDSGLPDTSLLPPEILERVFAALDSNDLAQCLRVNSVFYGIIRPRLARRVRYVARRGSEKFSPAASEGAAGLVGIPIPQHSAFPVSSSTRFHPRSVREISISAHSSQTCCDADPPAIPKRHYALLRLDHVQVNGDPLFHTDKPYDGHLEPEPSEDTHAHNASNGAGQDTSTSTCRLLDGLTATTLVFYRLSAYGLGSPALPPSLSSRVENLAFVLDEGFVGLCDPSERAALFPAPNPAYPLLKTMSIVLAPADKTGTWCPPQILRMPHEMRRMWFDRFLNALAASWFLYPVGTVAFRIANANAVHPSLVGILDDPQGIPGEYRRQVADVVQQRFAAQWRRVIPPSAGRKELEGLKFVSLQELMTLLPGAVDD